jgi:hypothetical protein
VALQAVSEVEDLTMGLSRKTWPTLTILYAVGPEARAPRRRKRFSAHRK